MLTLTPAAVHQIQSAIPPEASFEGLALRIAARRAFDGSIEYAMGMDNERDNDQSVVVEGITLLINEHSADLLNGVTVDFVEENGQPLFVFMNPNDAGPVGGGGGCGSSSGNGGGGGCGSGGCGSGGCGSR
ncbi:iron-sulfur cluster assembly accessory protein [Betaproteobacteria bacterium SCN2]|jgi:iron-sulfur cluster assembly protein|nr:iron-sulfur cluster assembly accessory protein [Betaproteobacteria bacterium SCN2]